mgnify:CR=1 FL=1
MCVCEREVLVPDTRYNYSCTSYAPLNTDKLRQRPPRACVPRPRLSSTYTTIGIVACVSRCGGRCMGASSIDRCMGASSIDRRYRLSSSIAPRRHRARARAAVSAVLSLPSPVSNGPLVVCLADA